MRLDVAAAVLPGRRARCTGGAPAVEPVAAVLDAHAARRGPRPAGRAGVRDAPSCCRCTADGPHGRRADALPGPGPQRSASRTSPPPARSPRRPGGAVDRVHRQSQQAKLAEALQRSLLTEPAGDPGRAPSSCGTSRPPRRPGSAATGTTPSCSATARRCWSSATSWATTRPPRPRWASCAGCCGASPTTAGRDRPRCCAGWTRPWPRCTAARWRPPWSPGWSAPRTVAGDRAAHGCAGPTPATRRPLLLGADGSVMLLAGAGPDLMLGVDADRRAGGGRGRAAAGDTRRPLHRRAGRAARPAPWTRAWTGCGGTSPSWPGGPLDELCDALLERMLQGHPQDDVALVAVALRGLTRGRCATGPGRARPETHRIGGWAPGPLGTPGRRPRNVTRDEGMGRLAWPLRPLPDGRGDVWRWKLGSLAELPAARVRSARPAGRPRFPPRRRRHLRRAAGAGLRRAGVATRCGTASGRWSPPWSPAAAAGCST